ncbi:serine-threonine kinase receptor-associated protein [Drosophila subobscura]|uniref:serine-threonine kinase receptor-associated protein n=1 Tax=Drosophila subobscura TaxID=7241 RepID=UPI00155AEEDE|nr:serine-threonine kinase receptor-associated protein [Drosophila subobscura]
MASNIPFRTRFVGHSDSVAELSFSPNGESGHYLASVGRDGLGIVRCCGTGQIVSSLKGHQGPVSGVSFGANAPIVATGSEDRTARIWSATSGHELEQFRHKNMVASVALDTESKRLLTSSRQHDAKIRLYDVNQSQECLSVYRKNRRGVRNVIFCREDRSFIASSYDRTVELWDISSGKVSHQISLPHHAKSLELCADGKTVTIGYGESIVFFNAETFDILGHHRMLFKVMGASLHPQKRSFVSADNKGFIYKFDYDTGHLQYKFKSHIQAGDNVTNVKYSPDGEMYASCSTDGLITFWPQTAENEHYSEDSVTYISSDSNDEDYDP